MEIHIFAKDENSLKGLIEHYGDSKKLKNRFTLKATGINQKLDVNKRLLIINFDGLIAKIKRHGGDFKGYKEQLKNNLLNDIAKTMTGVGAEPDTYEVVFNESTN